MSQREGAESAWTVGGKPAPVKPEMPTWKRALLQGAVAIAAGLLFVWRGHLWPARVVFAVAAFALVSGVAAPKAFHAWERFGRWLGRAVGVALTWGVLVPVFYLVFVPARLLLLLLRRDPMRRAFPSPAASYWTPYRPPHGMEQYQRQY